MFSRTKDLRLSIIKQMEIRASKYPDVVSLAQGIPNFDTPEGIKRRAENALKRGVVAKYSVPAGLPELRELIEASLARNDMFYDWEKEIIVTAGSIEGITASLLAISEPGDEILLIEPTYTSYREVIYLAGCKPVFVPLEKNSGWSFDIKRLEAAISPKTRAVLFCNPNNPTGTIFQKQDLLELGRLAQEKNFYIISDEVYKDFLYNDTPFFSLAQDPAFRKKLIRVFSFSKAFSMTGWRVGYLHSDESVVAEILKVHDSLVTCAPVISQYAAMGALEMGEKDLKIFHEGYLKRRELICSRLDKLAHVFEYCKPESSYFAFPGYKLEQSSWDFALFLLDKIQVAVVPGVAFGPSGEGHVRLSFGRSEDDINRAFDRLEKLFGTKK